MLFRSANDKQAVLDAACATMAQSIEFKELLASLIEQDAGPDLNRRFRNSARLLGNSILDIELLQKRLYMESDGSEAELLPNTY